MTTEEIKTGEQFVQSALKQNGYYKISINNENPVIEADGDLRKILVYIIVSRSNKKPIDVPKSDLMPFIKHAKEINREFWIATIKINDVNELSDPIQWQQLKME